MAPSGDSTDIRQRQASAVRMRYEIRIQGILDECWSCWFEGMHISSEPGGITCIRGEVVDQSALHGLLAKIRDLGLPLISVRRLDAS